MAKRMIRVMFVAGLLAGTLQVAPATAAHCTGVDVFDGADLVSVAASAPAGTTFCLHAGTYVVATPVPVQAGDQFIGEGRSSVFVKTTQSRQVFKSSDGAGARLESMDISGAVGDGTCKPSCGRGIWLPGANVVLDKLYVHHNANHGAGGMGEGLLITNSEFAHNGSSAFVGCCSGGVKMVKQSTIVDSYVHHNVGNGVWMDVCGNGLVVRNNTITSNTRSGVRYEHSRECVGSAVIHDNIIQNNNTSGHNQAAGVVVNSAPNADIAFNRFGGNQRAGVSVGGTRGTVSGTKIYYNAMNGDALRGCGLEGVTCSGNF